MKQSNLVPTNVPGLYKNRRNIVINENIGDYQRLVALRNRKKIEDKMQKDIGILQNEVKELRKLIEEIRNG